MAKGLSKYSDTYIAVNARSIFFTLPFVDHYEGIPGSHARGTCEFGIYYYHHHHHHVEDPEKEIGFLGPLFSRSDNKMIITN